MSAQQIADQLWNASAWGKPVAPIGDAIRAAAGDGSADDLAYAIQQINVERTVNDRGTRVCGRKIGLTAIAVQQQLGVDRPDFGALYADRAFGDGDTIDTARFISPRVEPEIALVLGTDLDIVQPTVADVIRATDYVLAAIEVVDSRIADWEIGFHDTVADNASGDSFVLGTVPHLLTGLNLADVEITMTIDGEVVSTGTGRACLGNPLFAARWLAHTLAAAGTPLRAGDVVMTGAVAAMAPFAPGAEVTADFGALGTLSIGAS